MQTSSGNLFLFLYMKLESSPFFLSKLINKLNNLKIEPCISSISDKKVFQLYFSLADSPFLFRVQVLYVHVMLTFSLHLCFLCR